MNEYFIYIFFSFSEIQILKSNKVYKYTCCQILQAKIIIIKKFKYLFAVTYTIYSKTVNNNKNNGLLNI